MKSIPAPVLPLAPTRFAAAALTMALLAVVAPRAIIAQEAIPDYEMAGAQLLRNPSAPPKPAALVPPDTKPQFNRALGPWRISQPIRPDTVLSTLSTSTLGLAATEPRLNQLPTPEQIATWPMLAPAGSVNLNHVYGGGSDDRTRNLAALLSTTVHSNAALSATLAIAADDEFLAYVNGVAVGTQWGPNYAHLDKTLLPIRLKPGENSILIYCANGTGPWGVFARLLPECVAKPPNAGLCSSEIGFVLTPRARPSFTRIRTARIELLDAQQQPVAEPLFIDGFRDRWGSINYTACLGEVAAPPYSFARIAISDADGETYSIVSTTTSRVLTGHISARYTEPVVSPFPLRSMRGAVSHESGQAMPHGYVSMTDDFASSVPLGTDGGFMLTNCDPYLTCIYVWADGYKMNCYDSNKIFEESRNGKVRLSLAPKGVILRARLPANTDPSKWLGVQVPESIRGSRYAFAPSGNEAVLYGVSAPAAGAKPLPGKVMRGKETIGTIEFTTVTRRGHVSCGIVTANPEGAPLEWIGEYQQ